MGEQTNQSGPYKIVAPDVDNELYSSLGISEERRTILSLAATKIVGNALMKDGKAELTNLHVTTNDSVAILKELSGIAQTPAELILLGFKAGIISSKINTTDPTELSAEIRLVGALASGSYEKAKATYGDNN